MFESEAMLNRLNRTYLARVMADYPEKDLDLEPQPGLHSARWILAHLAIVADFGLKHLGRPMDCPAEWLAAYGPASPPGTNPAVIPSREDLLAAITRGYDRLIEAAQSAPLDLLDRPHDLERLKWTGLATKGELMSHVLATHFALHLGQLSTLRRLLGFAPLF